MSFDTSFVALRPSVSLARPQTTVVLDQEDRNKLFNILIHDDLGELSETERKVVRSVMPSYNPTKWQTRKDGKFAGLHKAKLMLMWMATCSYVVAEAAELFELDSIAWSVGWCFGSENARHVAYQNQNFLLINPVNPNGTMKFQLGKPTDLDSLFSRAVHEATHIQHSYHNEDFSSAMTELNSRCIKHLPAIKQMVKNIRKVKMI